MNKKKISFVNVNFRQGPVELNAYFLPYSVGVLWAYAQSQPDIAAQWELGNMLWKREDIEQTAQQLSQHDIIGFSTYIWNRNYNYALAKRIKEINPKILIFFGGPEPAVTDPNVFKQHPYIDLICTYEGEITVSRILKQFEQADWQTIPGLLINNNGSVINTGDPERIQDLSLLPSPYLAGVFDNIVATNPNYTWNATLETNRGCPYHCTFCDWGSLTYSKVKMFPIDKVYDEIDWIANNAQFMYVADANFGMFIERDQKIIDKIIESQKRTNNHYMFITNWAKNQKAAVFDMIDKLTTETNCVTNGLSVSVQSMTPAVLDNIKRTNLNQHKLSEIFELGQRSNTPIYTDLILGLPGETLTSWKQSLYQVLVAGCHHGIDIIQCQLLENSEMNLFQRKLYRMKTKEVLDYMSQTTDIDDGPVETIEIITETSTMPRADMLEAQVWSSFMQLCHMSGFSSQIARFLKKAYDVDYNVFYDGLYDFMCQDLYMQEKFAKMKQHYDTWMNNGYLPHPVTEQVSQTGVNLITSLLLLIHVENQIDHVHNLVESYVGQKFDFLEPELTQRLFDYQRSMIVRYEDLDSLPKEKNIEFNFHGYITHGQDLYVPSKLEINFSEGKEMSYLRFHENLYYGRKRGFGRSHVILKNCIGE